MNPQSFREMFLNSETSDPRRRRPRSTFERNNEDLIAAMRAATAPKPRAGALVCLSCGASTDATGEGETLPCGH